MALTTFFAVAILACTVQAQVVKFTPCPEITESKCTVSEVRIQPASIKKTYAIVTKGLNTQLSFDFTPNFAAQQLKSGLFYATPEKDLEFEGLTNADSCNLTSCPTEAGKQQTLNYSLFLGQKLPKGKYPIKWKLWNPEDNTEICCFKTTLKLKSKTN